MHATFFFRFPPSILSVQKCVVQRKSLFIMKWVLYKQLSKLSRVCTTCKISQTLNCPVKSFLLEKSDALTVKGGGSENIWRPGQFLWAVSENTKLTIICEIKQKCKSEKQELVTYWGPSLHVATVQPQTRTWQEVCFHLMSEFETIENYFCDLDSW